MVTGLLAGLGAGALWGLVFVAPLMAPKLTSVDLAAGRFISYGLFAALVMVLTRSSHRWPTLTQSLAALGMSILGFTGYYFFLVLAIQDAGTEVPALIIGTIPIWVMLLGKPTHLSWARLVPGLLLTLLGLGLMVDATWSKANPVLANTACIDCSNNTYFNAPFNTHFWRGVAFAVAGTVSWTLFALQNARWLKRHPEVNATEWANWLGIAAAAGALLLWGFSGSEIKVLKTYDGIEFYAIVCIATGVGSAWLATLLWNVASQRLSASLCGQLIVSETLFALVYAYLWQGTWPEWGVVLASLFFMAGIVASIQAHR